MGLLKWLKKFRPTMKEVDGEYDGPFSTYPEIHATWFAIGYAFLFYFALFVYPPLTYLVALQILRLSYFALTGKRMVVGKTPLGLPDKYLIQIRDEPHYFLVPLAGLLVGVGVILQYVYGIDVIGRLLLVSGLF